MRRWSYRATFSLILLSLPVSAQRHGGSHSSGGAFAVHSSGAFHPVHSSGAFQRGSFGHSSRVRLRSGDSFHHHRTFSGRRFYYPYGAYYPYGWYPDSFDYQNDDRQTSDSYAAANYPGPYREDSGLERDVQALSGKIDRLQADVEAHNHPKTEIEPATALVFRDQHVEEVHNYAIAGGTLWVLNSQAAKKIPLAQLDLAATARMNDDRGVDFQVPK